MINIVIAEDHNSLIDGIELFFEMEEDICIVGKVNDGVELLEVLRKKHVNIVVTDIRMPRMDGIEATRIINSKYPHIKIIAFTMFGQKKTLTKMINAGAKGYLLKNASLSILSEAIRVVYRGENYYDPNVLIDRKFNGNIKRKSVLTKRQQEILNLIEQGFTNREIANKLFIEVHTVGTHRKNMIEKLGLKGQNSLLKYALSKKYESE
jgi:two-component system nitrate/nitrite response regulator NarL